MIRDWKDLLRDILLKDVSALIPTDIAFLKARQSYLTEEQVSLYSPLWGAKETLVTPSITYKELQAKARELGFKVKVGIKREDLELMIASVKV